MTSRFRTQYRELSQYEKDTIAEIKSIAEGLAGLIEDGVNDPRAQALALTNLEQSIMWAVKGITG